MVSEAGNVEHVESNSKSDLLDYLMRRFGGKVVKLAYYHVRDRHLAEDIMQEVFCRVYRHMDDFRNDSSYYTWIYRITVNLCNDYKKSAYFRKTLLFEGKIRSIAEEDAALFEEVEGGGVFSKVMGLPSKYRTVLALFYFEDMPSSEIAGVLGINENAVRTRLHRGRKMLRDSLEDMSDG